MSSEQLADGVNPLDAELAATWDVLKGYSGRDTDLGIARRFGGAAAAYSLRDIGAMNGRVVKVRRDSDDEEEDFSANQVSSGALEDWVNGKFEDTLPADVATAEAAYSLRKVKANYSGDAVRIRRSSDDVEVDVAFDSDGKVSLSSPITDGGTELTPDPDADLGSTTANTLNAFLNEDVNVETSDFSSNVDGYDRSSHGTVSRVASHEGESNVLKYVQDTGRNGIKNESVDINNVNSYTITFKYYAESAYNNKYLNFGYSFANQVSPSNYVQITSDSWQTATLTMNAGFTTNTSFLQLRVSDTNTDVYGTTTVGTIYYKDIVVTATESGAFVHTWYDQAGSNDATQATSANQPQIAEGGALLTKRGQTTLKFRGTDSVPIFLEASASITASHSVFIVGQPSPDGATALDGNDVANNTFWSAGNSGISLHIAGVNSAFSEGYRNSSDASRIFSYTATQAFHTSVNLHTAINGSSNFSYYANTVSKISDLNGTLTDTAITIGKKGTNISGFQPHNTRGFISELIQYNSDQSDNRFKIESNINNYYGLYTFQGDGFVETWYDQSGNGNNATQASDSNQPSIVINGAIYKDSNNLPSINFTATSTTSNEGRYLDFTKVNFGGTMSFFSKLFIRRPASGGNGRHFSEDGNAGADKSIIIMDTSQYNFFSGDSNIISGTGIQEANNVHTFLLNNQNELNIFINGGANSNNEITLANTIADFEIGRMGAIQEKGNSFEVDMDLSEAVFYSTDKTSDRTDIEREMANFYNITLS